MTKSEFSKRIQQSLKEHESALEKQLSYTQCLQDRKMITAYQMSMVKVSNMTWEEWEYNGTH